VPGVLVGLSQMSAVYVYSRVRGYPIYARATVPEFLTALGRALFAMLTPVIIIGGVVGGFFTPTEASVIAVIYSLVIGIMVYRALDARGLARALYQTARLASLSLFCIGTASAFGWLLAYYQIPKAVVAFLARYGAGVTSVGLIEAAAFLVIGCFIDAVPAIIIVGPLLAPVAAEVGMHPIHFAIIGVVSLAFGLVTPPYGLCLLIDCHIAGIKVSQALRDVLIILVPMLLMLLAVVFFPELILWIPRLLMPQFL
jgi:tripartite ATP-independent transporter DctM subunit